MSATRKNPRITPEDALALPEDERASTADKPASSTDAIVHSVMSAIVEHRLLPGTKLVEQTIGNRFGVSRTIVRQALFQLSQLKLVRLEPARGAFVAQPSVQETREVFAVRRMVETQLLRDVVKQITPAKLRRLRAHLKAERTALSRGDVPLRTRLLFDFHVRLADVLDNQVLTDLMRELVSRCSLMSLMVQSSRGAEVSHTEHEDILLAIEAGDSARAIRLLHRHLGHIESQLTEERRAPALPQL